MSNETYTVKSGDTLQKIADQFDVDMQDLALRNNIRDPNLIHVGQVITVREASNVYLVKSGDSLSKIANAHGTTVDAIMAANPRIRNPNLISVGQSIVIPTGSSSSSSSTGGSTTSSGGTSGHLSLTEKDIRDIKKTLQTEWVQFAGDDQAKGIVDTILNRLASDHWGSTIASVVNARNQFSDINGPVSRRDGRSSVDQIAMSLVSSRVNDFVDDYLQARSTGTGSFVDSHLNYANPHFSDARNLAWIMALDGPVLGRGNAIHRHGTVPELQRFRPDPFQVVLPGGTAPSASQSVTSTSVDGRAIAAQHNVDVKSRAVKISTLHPSMEAVIVAVSQAANELGLPRPVITSGNDSRHSRNSLHYSNRALDFRGRNITRDQGFALDSRVEQKLGDDYDVIFETFSNSSNNHLHVEYDPR
ncbi:LysM peptidoglycan-binding domain-containing protein [Erythrobacter sp. F6033]|uniref:LysM peptidoglycan-binding domain-containing protein n=1 Tax=Erythrobacter sp. F6033 TaxID=2926401 RepID=UPI001FF47C23|nr:LysM peptidoglycan-binding domain-containing protein [Erythrobacter sp. F6033]MCK0128671.1 LysM peptidoglycan-binding domain-containing protein [Erythrobacter sp. F6033]